MAAGQGLTLAFSGNIEPLSSDHDRRAFSCGVEALDDYLRRYARQHAAANVSRTYVAVDGLEIQGFYSLAMSASPPELVRRLKVVPLHCGLIWGHEPAPKCQGFPSGPRHSRRTHAEHADHADHAVRGIAELSTPQAGAITVYCIGRHARYSVKRSR